MKTRPIAIAAAVMLLASAASLHAQERRDARPSPGGSILSNREVARLYDSLSARPGWPTQASEAEVDAYLAQRRIRPEDRKAIIAAMKQDVCRMPDMAPVCRYYGAETIYKVQKLSWSRDNPGRETGLSDPRSAGPRLALQLMEYGAARNLQRLYDKGLTDEQEAQLNNATAAKAASLISLTTKFSVWFHCADDTRSLSGSWPSQYRLTTCGAGFGWAWWLVILKWEWAGEIDFLTTHSRFARKVLLLWWPTGAEPNICADSVINGSGNQKCSNFNWLSPISMKIDSNSNPLANVVSNGTASRLGQGFSVSITHQ